MFLISEYCGGTFYSGWHLYLRESAERQKRNSDGDWGWLRRDWHEKHAHVFLATIGIILKGDGSCENDAYAEMAARFPIPRQRIWGKPRGCIPVNVGEFGEITLRVNPNYRRLIRNLRSGEHLNLPLNRVRRFQR